MIPILEPSTQQEAYDMMKYAYALSEEKKLPVLLRVVTRLAHSRAGVVVNDLMPQNDLNPDKERTWVLLPAIARRQYASLVAKQPDLVESSEHSPYNGMNAFEGKAKLGVIACGIAYNYVMENDPQSLGIPVLKVSQYPLPEASIKALAAH